MRHQHANYLDHSGAIVNDQSGGFLVVAHVEGLTLDARKQKEVEAARRKGCQCGRPSPASAYLYTFLTKRRWLREGAEEEGGGGGGDRCASLIIG